jgi:hypothetical protein
MGWFSWSRAKKAVSALSFGAFTSPGPITVHRPIGFAPNGYFVTDLPDLVRSTSGGLFVAPGESVDLGNFYTQKQINDSIDLKRALISGALTWSAAGTTPTLEPVEANVSINPGSVTIGAVQLRDGVADIRQTVKSDGVNNAAVVVQNDAKTKLVDAGGVNQASISAAGAVAVEGILVAAEKKYVTEIFSPGAAFANARPVNGDLDTSRMAQKEM